MVLRDLVLIKYMKQSGIYRIVNKINGKGYVGSSKDLVDRWRRHKRLLQDNKHHSNHLQYAWNKYGEDKFEFVILEYIDGSKGQKYLREREQYWIDFYNASNPEKGYNISKKSQCIDIPPYERTEEHKEKMRKRLLGRVLTKEWKKKISDTRKRLKIPSSTLGKTWTTDKTVEKKLKIKEFCLKNGYRPTSESADVEEKKLGSALLHYTELLDYQFDSEITNFIRNFPTRKQFNQKLGIGDKPFLGKHHTVESKEKNRQAHLGRKHSTKAKLCMSIARKDKKQNPWQGFRISQTKLQLNMTKRFFKISGVN